MPSDKGQPPPDAEFISNLLVALGMTLREIVGETTADQAFSTIARKALNTRIPAPSSWPRFLSHLKPEKIARLPVTRRLGQLHRFAHSGAAQLDGGPSRSGRNLKRLIDDVDALCRSAPRHLNVDRVETLVRMARGRLALRQNHPVDPRTLAALGGVTEGHIRNLLVERRDGLKRHKKGEDKIGAQSALAWLRLRRGYRDMRD